MTIQAYYSVASEADLNAAIAAINVGGASSASNTNYTITVTSDFTLTADLSAINLASGDGLTITGQSNNNSTAVIDGDGVYRGFVVNAGAVVLDSLVLQGMVAKGGAGGNGSQAGGGAAGLGGAIFIASGASVELSNTSFASNRAVGGRGGTISGGGTGAGGSSNLPAGFGNGGAGGAAGSFGGGGGSGAAGGFGGGNNAGGGLAAGGNIFIEAGGNLTVSNGAVGAGGLTAGGADSGGTAGAAYGSGIFIQGNTRITLGNVTVSGVIADQTGSGGSGANAGAGAVVIDGTATLSAANTYTGGTQLQSGSLTLDSRTAAGSGAINLAGAAVELIVGPNDIPANVVTGFFPGETIDLQGIGVASAPTLGANNQLTIQSGAGPITLNLDPGANYSNDTFLVQPDSTTGALVTVTVSQFTVASESDLNTVLSEIDAGGEYAAPGVAYTIHLSSSFTLTGDLAAINLAGGDSLTIDGGNQTIDGGNAYRGFFDYSGPLTIENLTIKDAAAIGGAGGAGAQPGGGGAGLGGGLFVAAGGAATLANVQFVDDSAVGGAGGAASVGGTGGGGGLGGAGGAAVGNYAGGGGGIGVGATGGSKAGAHNGGAGIVLASGPANSGTGGSAGSGGIDGGGGGAPGTFSGSGRDPHSSPGAAGAGGIADNSDFGGGAASGQKAGFGGGGAASSGGFGGGGSGAHSGGFGAGAGSSGGAGGGLGAGGAVFVAQGGSLTITGGVLSGGVVSGGAGSNGGGSGAQFGSGIFIQGSQNITLAGDLGQPLVIGDVIADPAGSVGGASGAGSVVIGGGTVDLNAANTFTGGVTIQNDATLSLGNASAAGTGMIAFVYGGSSELIIGSGDIPANTISGFLPGDSIDIQGIGTATNAQPGINNVLAITGGSQNVTLNLDPNQNLTAESFVTASDQHGGTLVTAVTVGNDNPPHISGAGVTINGSDTAPLDPLGGVTVADLDSGATETATLTLSSTANGTLSNFGIGTYDTASGVYSVSGSPAAVTAALDALVFTPLAHEVAPGQAVQTSFALSVTDGTMIDAATNVANIVAANTPPAIDGLAPPFIPGYFTVAQTPFAGTTIVDPDFGATETVTIALNNANGTLSLAAPVDGVSLTETAPGSGVYTLTSGTPAAVTAALDAVNFTPSYNASGFTITSLGISVSDGTATTTASTSVLAGAPVIAGAVADQPLTDVGTIAPFSTVTITDSPEFTSDSVTITVTDGNNVDTDANGFLEGSGLSHVGVGIYTLTAGTPSFITSELQGLVFVPTEHQVPAGQSVTTSFVISVANGASTSDNGTTSVVATATAGNTYILTTGPDTVKAGANNDDIIAANGTLNRTDNIDGGGGSNTLTLTGAGIFDLRVPATLANITFVTAQEAQPVTGAANGGVETVYLRRGLNATVDVAPALLDAGNTNAATITVIGVANDSSIINLAAGNDVVTIGSASETVHGGAGIDTIDVKAATIGATIDGGSSGKSVLSVAGGGTMAMGAKITDIDAVNLTKASAAYHFIANSIAGLTVNDLSAGKDSVRAGGTGQVLTGGAAGKLTMTGFSGGSTTFEDTSAQINNDTIANFTAAGDVIDLTDMASATLVGTFTENTAGTAGKLHVTDGTHSATILLLGQFAAAGFSGSLASAGFSVGPDPVAGADISFNHVLAAATHG